MQANSEISVLHLTNDRPNCNGLLLLLTVFVSSWAYYMRDRHLSLPVRRKITVNFFIQRLQTFIMFVTFFTFLTFFLFLGERFFIYASTIPQHC